MSTAPEPRPDSPLAESSVELTSHEEVANATSRWVDDETVRVKTNVETIRVDESVPRSIVFADVERETPDEDDDGKVRELPDGSLSVPVLEEQIMVTKRTVVRERIIVRKRTVTETVQINDEVRREHIDVEASPGLDVSGAKVERGENSPNGATSVSKETGNSGSGGRPLPFPGSSVDPRRTR